MTSGEAVVNNLEELVPDLVTSSVRMGHRLSVHPPTLGIEENTGLF